MLQPACQSVLHMYSAHASYSARRQCIARCWRVARRTLVSRADLIFVTSELWRTFCTNIQSTRDTYLCMVISILREKRDFVCERDEGRSSSGSHFAESVSRDPDSDISRDFRKSRGASRKSISREHWLKVQRLCLAKKLPKKISLA